MDIVIRLDILLPPEMLSEIMTYLDVISFIHFTSASKVFAQYKHENMSQYKYPCGYIGWRHQTCDKETSECFWCYRFQCNSLFIYINEAITCRFGCLFTCRKCNNRCNILEMR